jgi:endoglycosylceramidase
VLVVLALAVAAVSVPTAEAGDPFVPQVGHALGVRRGPHAAIVDDQGRQVLLRGVNVNQLGEYYQDAPDLPATVPLTEADFAGMAALGFDVVRLLVTWSRVEPTPGVIDTAYIEQVRQAVEWARSYDLYVIVDMHQDAWGPHVATPPGAPCPPGFTGNVGWDGAPRWATFTDGASTCKLAVREVSPAVAQAFTNFYLDRPAADGVGIQTHLVRAWGALARAFAGDPAVAGYDLLNEPNPGYLLGGLSEVLGLGRFYARAIDAIRRNGGTGIAFFEPIVYWSLATVAPVPLPGFTADHDIAFAPHLYGGSIAIDAVVARSLGLGDLLPATMALGFVNAEVMAALHGAPWFSGEWGWFGDPATDGPLAAEYGRLEDAHLAGGAWWSWKQACGDPHNIGTPGNRPGPVSPSLHRISCPGGEDLGIPPQFARVLSRAYPRAAPGRLIAITSDPDDGSLTVEGESAGGGVLDLWVPDRGLGPPDVRTGQDAAVTAVTGGWRLRVAVGGGRYAVTVEPSH